MSQRQTFAAAICMFALLSRVDAHPYARESASGPQADIGLNACVAAFAVAKELSYWARDRIDLSLQRERDGVAPLVYAVTITN
jgi:hypothetical protein